jgi:transposase
MTRPYSSDLRERVVGSVERGELSRRQAAVHYGVGISSKRPAWNAIAVIDLEED